MIVRRVTTLTRVLVECWSLRAEETRGTELQFKARVNTEKCSCSLKLGRPTSAIKERNVGLQVSTWCRSRVGPGLNQLPSPGGATPSEDNVRTCGFFETTVGGVSDCAISIRSVTDTSANSPCSLHRDLCQHSCSRLTSRGGVLFRPGSNAEGERTQSIRFSRCVLCCWDSGPTRNEPSVHGWVVQES